VQFTALGFTLTFSLLVPRRSPEGTVSAHQCPARERDVCIPWSDRCPSELSFRPETMPAMKQANKSANSGNRSARRRRLGPPRSVFTMSYPSSRKVRLVFVEGFAITEGAAGAGAFRYLRLNSAYDVDTTLGSTSTPGFAEWSAFYNNYRVWSTAVSAEVTVSGGGTGAVATVALVPNALQATLPTNPVIWPVQPQSLHRNILAATSGGHNKATFRKRYDIASLFRVTRSQFSNDFDFTATTSANPARQAYLAFTVYGNASSSAFAAVYQVYVSMEIEFFNPVQLAT
jgi:hypothetical protein